MKMNKTYLKLLSLTLSIPLLLLGVATSCSENSEKGLGVDYLDGFSGGQSTFALTVYDEPTEPGWVGSDIIYWEKGRQEVCSVDASNYFSVEGLEYIFIHLNRAEPGVYKIVDPTVFDYKKLGIANEKLAIVLKAKEYQIENGPEDTHRAYSGQVTVTGDNFSAPDKWNAGTQTGIHVALAGNFAIKDIRTMECSGSTGEDGVSVTDSCLCDIPGGEPTECTPLDGSTTCCPDLETETIEYTYSFDSMPCAHYCVADNDLLFGKYCTAPDVSQDSEFKECTVCEQSQSTRVYVDFVYEDGSPAVTDGYYFEHMEDKFGLTWINGGPKLSDAYPYNISTDVYEDDVRIEILILNSSTSEIVTLSIPHVWQGCTNRNVTYQKIVFSKDGTGGPILGETLFLNPCEL